LIVIAKPEANLRVRRGGEIASIGGTDVTALSDFVKNQKLTMVPLFAASEERIMALTASVAATVSTPLPDLSIYYRVEAPDDQLDELAAQLQDHDVVEAAYVKPPGEPPQRLNDMQPAAEDAPPTTPNFTLRQAYLDPAPGGIDARYAWTRSGGGGNGVRITDLEWAWRFSHEDLIQTQGGVVGGSSAGNTDHGTAVLGEISGDRNAFGITGICPDAVVTAVAFSMPSATAIRMAADRLNAGDIMLLEIHRPGPRNAFQSRGDQNGYIAIEWWPDDFDAIRYATARGIIVVEAAGNGTENLDDPIYSNRPANFPASWTNPFNRSNRDSGAIVVGAGAPPPGTHGHDWGPDRSRLDFSNYGAFIDAQGWGREVTSTGYGDLQGGTNQDLWYTDQFSGTSSASPIIVGALGCTQGVLRASGRPLLTPATARQLLRDTGTPQQDAPGRPATQRIGNRPNLRQMITKVTKNIIKEIAKEKLELKERKLEKQELKELKIEKVEIKEQKLEKLEAKEQKLEKVEIKDFKEVARDKIQVENFGDLFQGMNVGQIRGVQPADLGTQGTTIEERVARLEAVVSGNQSGLSSSFAAEGTDFSLAQDDPAAAALFPPPLRRCVDFRQFPVGNGSNPLNQGWATFQVYNFGGVPAPNSRITTWGGFTGLVSGFSLEILLAASYPEVELTLVHFAHPATVTAYNATGAVVASATMSGPQHLVETRVLRGTAINRVVVRAPQDETLLLRFCAIRRIKIPKIEKLENKEQIKTEIKEKPETIEQKIQKDKDKDKDKDKELFEGFSQQQGIDQSAGNSIEQRLGGLETTVAQLAHFINPELRPDLGSGALTGEPDVSNPAELSQQLAKEANDAKQAKDSKDFEKLGER
jgi:hypothetical protein